MPKSPESLDDRPDEPERKSPEKGSTRWTRKEMLARIEELNQEYRDLGIESRSGNVGAQQRQAEVARELRALSSTLYLREPEVEVNVRRSATGHPYRIGDRIFTPGIYTVKKSVAQYLIYLMDRNQVAEVNRLRQNGEEVDLGPIGSRATMVDDEGRSI